MLKRTMVMAAIVLSALGSLSSFAGEIKELEATYPDGRDVRWGPGMGGKLERANFVDRVLCVDGVKVFQTVVYTDSSTGGAAVSSLQLYEEKDGKSVPMRCGSK